MPKSTDTNFFLRSLLDEKFYRLIWQANEAAVQKARENANVHSSQKKDVIQMLATFKQKLVIIKKNNLNSPHLKDYNLQSNIIQIGQKHFFSHEEANANLMMELVKEIVKSLMPWRKGPYRLFDVNILSEWNSYYKWNRLIKKMGAHALHNKIICDVGANNGYFIFKALPFNPKYVLALEPTWRYKLQYDFLHTCLTAVEEDKPHKVNIDYLLLGYEALTHMPQTFDIIFCLGILYHHTDPISILKLMKNALKTNGQVIIDCQGIKGSKSIALTPHKTYGGSKGFWHLPTKTCLINWLYRAGFQNVNVLYAGKLTSQEQASSKHAPYPSLKEGLSKWNKHKTIEGYPSPYRFYVSAKKN